MRRINLLLALILISVTTTGCITREITNQTNRNSTAVVNNNITAINSAVVNTNVGVDADVIPVGPSAEELTNLADQGQLVNANYGFIIDVSAAHAGKVTEQTIIPFEGVTATYVYCYATTDTTAESTECPAGSVETFRINVYTSAQYDAIKDGPGAGSLITEAVGYVYELAHPNGLLPEDVPADEAFYEAVVASFHFAG